MKVFFKYWLPVIIWAGLIFGFSSIPNLKSDLPSIWDLILRKIAHFLEFAILAVLFLRLGLRQEKNKKGVYLAAILFSIFYAGLDEYHQSFVFGRTASVYDVLIDSSGVIISSLVYFRKKMK